jgi:non-ribosomal peptide synthase protein (TIGR01720 family)
VPAADAQRELLEMHQQLELIPQGGAGLLPLQVACEREEVAERARRIPKAEVWFNYLGTVNDTLSAHERADADIPTRMSEAVRHIQGVTHDPRTPRERTLSLLGFVRNGVLELSFEYSAQLHREETIRELAQQLRVEMMNTLRAVGAI